MERVTESNDILVIKKMELTSNETGKHALLAGRGYSIMPLIGIRNELHNNELQIVPLKGLPITTTWSLIWLKGKKYSPISLSFLEHLEKEKSKIVQEHFS